MISDTPLLEARNVGRRHRDGRAWLLRRVSLSVRVGQRLAVTGASGCGKSLLLRALALLDPLDEGQIRWQGAPVSGDEIPAFRRQTVYLPQRPALGETTVEAALREPFSLEAHRVRRFDPEWIAERLADLGRDESFLRKQVRDLSGGESQIAALVRAVQLDPPVLLLDEPTAALDAEATRAVERWLDRWLAEAPDARALVWVSHDAAQARRVAGRVLSMRSGRLAEESGT